MFGFIGMLIVGGLIGWAAGAIMGKDIPGGILGNIIAGIIGSWLGGTLLGHWGPELGSIYILPALIGSIILIALVTLILRAVRKKKNIQLG
ncbi:GlsB/YeaQ/YmgE family stress response membrane protein [Staphylococcus aureus]|nr:GlsB/YeaQ/YmgE family stress response membrane protein [Staphylococcus aureus]